MAGLGIAPKNGKRYDDKESKYHDSQKNLHTFSIYPFAFNMQLAD